MKRLAAEALILGSSRLSPLSLSQETRGSRDVLIKMQNDAAAAAGFWVAAGQAWLLVNI